MSSRAAGKIWIACLCALCGLLYAIRLSGPTDLESYAQAHKVGFVLDLIKQGHWLLQRDLLGALISEPPFHTWAMAAFVAIFGLNRLALTLPSFLAVLALCLLVFGAGSGGFARFVYQQTHGRFDRLAGGLATLAIVLVPPMAQQIALVGSDPVFALAVSIAALSAFVALEQGSQDGKAWLLFWLMAAIATLTKGPLGLLLAAGGLVGCIGRTAQPAKPANARLAALLAGIVPYLVLTLAWYVAVWLNAGDTVIKPFLTPNWIAQPGDLLKPPLFLLLRYLPFSLPLVFALWRVFRHPAADATERRFERFLSSWLLGGMLVLAIFSKLDADALLPLWPAGALLAGRELAIFARRIGVTRFAGIGMVLGIVMLGATYAAVNAPLEADGATRSAYARERKLAKDARTAAEAFKASELDASQLVHVGTPQTLQLYFGTYRPLVDRAALIRQLAMTDNAVDVALGGSDIASLGLADAGFDAQQFFRWPTDESQPPVIQVYRVERFR